MEGIYRIASFNLHNIGYTAFSNDRNLELIAKIITEENLDIVAFQEVLSEGKIFTKEDAISNITKRSILSYLGGADRWGFEWADAGDDSKRHEGYAFLWNKERIRPSEAEVTYRNGTPYKRVYTPRMLSVNKRDMKRKPYYARFTPQGMLGGSNCEIRIICVHTFYGDDSKKDRLFRQNEIDILLKEIYPAISQRPYQNGLWPYTILLGDYNAELLTKDIIPIVEKRNIARRIQKLKIPAVIETDSNGEVYSEDSEGKRIKIKTVQYNLTTLKTKQDTIDGQPIKERGYACNYDHFSYEEANIQHVLNGKPRIIDAVRKYCRDGSGIENFERYQKTVSDHIPIVLELKINN